MTKFTAELSINHLGMVNIAKKMIYSANEAGADYVKLKYKNVKNYYSEKSQKIWRNFNFQDYRASLELSKDDFENINDFCKTYNIKWFCTIHDEDGLDFIKRFDLPFYKIASMDSANTELLLKVKKLCLDENKTMIISVGGKTHQFTDKLIKSLKEDNLKAFILHTVSIYPTPIGQSNIGYIKTLIDKYEDENIRIGYSGHEIGYGASLVAASLGANMIERHFSLSRDINIHHIKSALLPNEFAAMIRLISELKEEMSNSEDFSIDEFKFLENRKYE